MAAMPEADDRPTDHVARNREAWDRFADRYQAMNARQIREQAFTGDIAWGVWGIPESELHILGEVGGRRVLEFGCGGAQWSTALARRGARPVGVDLSGEQLSHARRLMDETGIRFPLVQANAEELPLRDESFDIVFADHGAFSFADPYRTIPEAARVLRSGGLLAFSHVSILYMIATRVDADHATEGFVHDYFGFRSIRYPDDGMEDFNLPYGEWIRLFRGNGLVLEDLIEPRPEPGASSTYRDAADVAWSRRWPSETIWRLRKA
jgi:ubiquinone/menaquinone biosynthesis C-methylase UbiE